MNRKLTVVFGLLVCFSMVLGACAAPTATPEPQQEATAVPAETTVEEPTAEAVTEEPTAAPAEPTSDRTGGWVDKIVFSAIPEVDAAVEQLQAGTIDMYAVSAEDATVFDTVKNDANEKYATVYGSNNQLLFNTVACSDTTILNPFTDAKIREAMNWAVDRSYISEEIMGGLAKPKFTALSSAFADYARYAGKMAEIETKYAYNLDKAKEVVDAEMPVLGAELGADGKWMFQGKPVTIIGLIRSEDKRLEIGNYFSDQLEALGFTVDRQIKTRTEAGPIWQGEPADCGFTFYTAGWISTAISRDDGNMFIQYNTGQMQAIPLFNEYTPSAELLDAATKLYTNSFADMTEREDLFNTSLDLAMAESNWGIWVTDNLAYSPYSAKLSGAYDLAGGFGSSQLLPYTLRFADSEGGEVKIAQSGILVQPWNPIAGSNWTDDAMVQRFTMDYGAVYDPYTGLLLPKLVEKAEVVVKNGLPVNDDGSDWVTLSTADEIKVPEDAWVDWDAANQKFITAAEKFPEGTTANVKSTVYYIPDLYTSETWHDGSPFTIGDVVNFMILNFDLGKPESKLYDETLAPGVETFLTHFKGVKIVSQDPLVIETYDDTYALDSSLNITTWFPEKYYPSAFSASGWAWHDLVGAELAEENGELAFSTDKAQANEVEWTSLIAGPSLETQMKYLDQAIADSYIPFAPTLSEYITADEAAARYANLKAFYEAHGHIALGTGPYMVDAVYPVEGSIVLTRVESYPFSASMFADFGEPKLATVAVEGPVSVTKGEEAAFDITVDFNGEAYPSDQIASVAYLVFDAENNVVATGEAVSTGDGMYQAVLDADTTAALTEGGSKISVAVTSAVVSIPAFGDYEFVVSE